MSQDALNKIQQFKKRNHKKLDTRKNTKAKNHKESPSQNQTNSDSPSPKFQPKNFQVEPLIKKWKKEIFQEMEEEAHSRDKALKKFSRIGKMNTTKEKTQQPIEEGHYKTNTSQGLFHRGRCSSLFQNHHLEKDNTPIEMDIAFDEYLDEIESPKHIPEWEVLRKIDQFHSIGDALSYGCEVVEHQISVQSCNKVISDMLCSVCNVDSL